MASQGDSSQAEARHTDRSEIAHPWFAAAYHCTEPLSERVFGPHREYLVAGLSGRILDLGAGAGAMIPYVDDVRADGSELAYVGIEPDPHMRRRAAERAASVALSTRLDDARAEVLPYPDDSFDTVVAAVVFCTIEEPEAALDEVARVLEPGGEFRFLEHVGADGWRRRVQSTLTPVWKRLAGGCHLDRETVPLFVGHDAFDVIELERLDSATFPAAPVVRGRLRRKRAGLL